MMDVEDERSGRLLREFESLRPTYEEFSRSVSLLLGKLLRKPLQIHSINCRVKDLGSLSGKLRRPDKKYDQLDQITDLAGVRITTYFAEDVELVARVIESEFQIDTQNSVDKREVLDPDRFGYQSLHYVCSLNGDRVNLGEYKDFTGIKVEIQVRSILQHAWAEIEHDLGYKAGSVVPKPIKRRFARVAGLLELADDEFARIRRELSEYAESVSEVIKGAPADVGIDKISLRSVFETSPSAVKRLSETIASLIGASLLPLDDRQIDEFVASLILLGVDTVAKLEQAVACRAHIVGEFAEKWLDGTDHLYVPHEIGLLYLCYVLLGEMKDAEKVIKFIEINHFLDGANLMHRIFNTYDSIVDRGHND
jgi:putative GTP pyrophosphokinase